MKHLWLLLVVALLPRLSWAQDTEPDTLAPAAMSVPLGVQPRGSFFSPTVYSYGLGGLGFWDLHPGLNAPVGAGVRVGWGRHNPWRGASFFSHLAALYAMPLSKDGRWTAAVGGYHANYRLWGSQTNSLGLMGMVDYRINERLDVSGFVMHDFGVLGQHGPMHMTCPLLGPSTTVGGELGIRLTEGAMLNLGLSFTRYHDADLQPLPHTTRTPELPARDH